MVQVRTQNISLTMILCFYVIFAFSISPYMGAFNAMSIEVTDQSSAGVFSSLSRNFEKTVEEINNADEKSTSSASPSSDSSSSNNADEKSTSSASPSSDSSSSNNADEKSTSAGASFESSNVIGNNSTTTVDSEKKNQTSVS